MLNKSNFWPPRGSDHSPSVKIATFRGKAKVRFIQQRPNKQTLMQKQRATLRNSHRQNIKPVPLAATLI
ncbi:hypothetical protein [Serratia symbiotica]|uniref:hypothetical protein n=1 Tax=Serratia symbiotica TaxID=138074 RepID=UPI0030D23972|nr:hypothetical protein [Serratia symbiotica]